MAKYDLDQELIKISDTYALVRASLSKQHRTNIQKLLKLTEIECCNFSTDKDSDIELEDIPWPLVRVFAPMMIDSIQFRVSPSNREKLEVYVITKNKDVGNILISDDDSVVFQYATSVFKGSMASNIKRLAAYESVEKPELAGRAIFTEIPCQVLYVKNLEENYHFEPQKIVFVKGFFSKYAEWIGAKSVEEARDMLIEKAVH